jgi:hypothetical protein
MIMGDLGDQGRVMKKMRKIQIKNQMVKRLSRHTLHR